MGLELHEVSSEDRPGWMLSKYSDYYRIYMGDGFYDHKVFEVVDLAIAPAGAMEHVKQAADFVTSRKGGDRAVAEAGLYILREVFNVSI
jgi:3-deoxy-D-manno-octulosonate 8-phosphate phosphatase KdsC-like HAD superfamily phosphatase